MWIFAVSFLLFLIREVKPLSINTPMSLSYPMSLDFLQNRLQGWSDASKTLESDSSIVEKYHIVEEDTNIEGIQASAVLTTVFGTKSRASKACKDGLVLLDGKVKIYGTRKVFQGDRILLRFPLEDKEGSAPLNQTKILQDQERLLSFVNHFLSPVRNPPVHILYEDEDVAVVFKPAGIHSLAYLGTSKRNLFAFDDILPVVLTPSSNSNSDSSSISTSGALLLPRPLPCHRLDSRVAGCLVAAKSKRAMAEMSWKFEAREVQKEYRAVLAGSFDPTQMTQFIALGKNDTNGLEASTLGSSNTVLDQTYNIYFDVDGRSAHTEMRVLDVCPCNVYGNMTLVSLSPHTGRRHQLRQHCAILGCPMIGDDLYHDIAYLSTIEARIAALSCLGSAVDNDAILITENEPVHNDEEDENSAVVDAKLENANIDVSESARLSTIATRSNPRVRRGVGLFLASVGVSFDHPIEGASKRVDVRMYTADEDHDEATPRRLLGTPPRFLRLMEKAAKGNKWTKSQL